MPKFKIPKPKLNAKTHIAMGLAFLVITLLLAAVSLQLVPDRLGAVRESRATLAQTVAINSSAFIVKPVEIRRRRILSRRSPRSLPLYESPVTA